MTKINLHFRMATPADAAQLQELVQSAFRAEDSRERWTGDTELSKKFHVGVDEIMVNINKTDSATLMATNDSGVLVGSLEVSKRGNDLARLSMLAVDHRHHRGGIGHQVLAHAEDYCRREWGVKKLGLNALSTREELIAWYERCGFRKTGDLSPFPRDRFADLTLPEDLCFVELEKDLNTVPTATGTE